MSQFQFLQKVKYFKTLSPMAATRNDWYFNMDDLVERWHTHHQKQTNGINHLRGCRIRKLENCQESQGLVDKEYIIQPVALKVQGSLSESSEVTLASLNKCSVVPTMIMDQVIF